MPTIHVLPLWAVKSFLDHKNPQDGALLVFWWDDWPRETLSAAKRAGVRVLDLRVADTDLSEEKARELGLEPFNREHAKTAARFLVDAYMDGVRLFIFACEAGRSRSASAASAFVRWLKAQGEEPRIFSMFSLFPNQRIEELLTETLFDLEGLSEKDLLSQVDGLIERPVEWDANGYPTEESLKRLSAWFEGFWERTKKLPEEVQKMLFQKTRLLFCRVLLENRYGDRGVKIRKEQENEEKKVILEYNTLGWSGNEDIIVLLRHINHGLWWRMFWRWEKAGGHYKFKIPEEIACKIRGTGTFCFSL